MQDRVRARWDCPLSPRGTREWARRLAASPAPSAALLTLWMRQEEHEGASLPSHQPRALPGLPSGRPYLPLEPGPGPSPFEDGAGVSLLLLGVEGRQPRLLYILHRDSIGSPRRTWLRGWAGGLVRAEGRAPCALLPSGPHVLQP